MFGHGTARRFVLIHQEHVDGGGANGSWSMPANDFCETTGPLDRETKGPETLQLPETVDHGGQVVGIGPESAELQPFIFDAGSEAGDLEHGHTVPPMPQRSAQGRQGIEVAGNGRANNSKMGHSEC